MVDTKTPKKTTNPLVFVGIGCLVLVIIISAISAIVGRFVAKKVGTGIFEKALEAKTGIKANVGDLEKGKMTFTDSKTGAKVDIGGTTVPDTFPKDFPLYPGAKVTSSVTGSQTGSSNGFWLTMTTGDSSDKVLAYYKTEFTKNGWTVDSTMSSEGMTNQAVSKGTWKGSLSVGKDSSDKETQITIILGEEK